MLATVEGIHVADNMVLASVSFGVVPEVDGPVVVEQNPALTTLELPGLEATFDVFRVNDNDALTALELPKLLGVDHADIHHNAVLASVSMPLFRSVGEDLSIYENPSLTSLELPMLMRVEGAVSVHDNAMLPSCQVMAFVDRLVDFTGSVDTDGNDGDATCL